MNFNEQEKEIIDIALNTNENIFLHGPGGTGKSTLLKEIAKQFSKQGKKVAITAATGVAAINVGGGTLHRFAGIGLGKDDKFKLYKKVMSKRKYIDRWRDTQVLIIDETSMIGGELFDKINYIAKKVRQRKDPMGNLKVIISGDLLQLPPINDKWIFESESWEEFNFLIFNLRESRRYEKDEYFEMLLRIRESRHSKNDIKLLQECVTKYEKVEDDIETWDIQPTILYSRRIDVDYHNKNELDKLDDKEYNFDAIDSFEFRENNTSEEQKAYYKTILNDAIPERIYLKKGAQVMLRKNLDVELGLVNGSRGVVIDINVQSNEIMVMFLNGITMPIVKDQWEIDDNDVLVIRQQIPLILAWSITIHKSQGATLDSVICDIGSSVFAFSQAYVALSRVKDIKGLYLTDLEISSIRTDPTALAYVKQIDKPLKITKIEELVFDDNDYFIN